MDIIYGSDRKLSELGERDLPDFLDHDLFRVPHGPSSQNCFMDFPLDGYSLEDGTWMNTYLNPILDNDLVDEPQLVKSEHSYSLNKGGEDPVDLTFESKIEVEQETDLLDAINPNLTCMHDPNFIASLSTCDDACLSPDLDTSNLEASSLSASISCQSILHRTVSFADRVFPHTLKVPLDIKTEPLDFMEHQIDHSSNDMYDAKDLPLTPPLSSPGSSDSEGTQSISMSSPPSPGYKCTPLQQELPVANRHNLNPWASIISQPTCLFTSDIPSSGILILTEEEKRTLISEGYPLPTKLPLTKLEEKNLKKIRRKIKNKISAQESRRKRRNIWRALKKVSLFLVESVLQENVGLKKKIDILENNNRSLVSELQKLQAVTTKVVRVSSAGPIGACLMVN